MLFIYYYSFIITLCEIKVTLKDHVKLSSLQIKNTIIFFVTHQKKKNHDFFINIIMILYYLYGGVSGMLCSYLYIEKRTKIIISIYQVSFKIDQIQELM